MFATVIVDVSPQSGLASLGYIETAIVVFVLNCTAIASRINFLEVAIPKSLTFLALNFHVFFLVENPFSATSASA